MPGGKAARDKPKRCELCGRHKPLSFHHLIPKKTHSKRRFQRLFSKEERTGRGIWVCRLCHRQIHRFFTEVELAESYNTREALVAEPQMASFLAWARKQR